MSWINLNDSLNNIKGQISSFANGVLADGNDNTELVAANAKIEELQGLCTSLEAEVALLKNRENQTVHTDLDDHEANWSWELPNTTKSDDNIISNLRMQIADLENEKRDLINSLEQLDVDCQQTTDKLVTLKDALQSDHNNLKAEHEKLQEEHRLLQHHYSKIKEDNENLLKNNNDLQMHTKTTLNDFKNEMQNKLEENEAKYKALTKNYETISKEYEELQKTASVNAANSVNSEEYKKLAKILNEYESKVSTLEKDLFDLQAQNNKREVEFNNLEQKYGDIIKEKQKIHEKYVEIITENVKKYVEAKNPSEFQHIHENEQDPQVLEFNKQVESIVKLLLDFKSKTEVLEKDLYEMTEEKTRILTEKNYEIEKLLKNSEILSQEVITKTQTIKEYEHECAELMKNNDLLISELDSYKNNSVLQTISETNEDNLLLLESQLENASKQIKELEMTVSDLENSKQDVNLETQTELEYIKKQLNLTGTELSQNKKDYQDLLVKYDKIETEYNSLKKQYLDYQSTSESEKQELRLKLDDMKSDLENFEYRYLEEVETSKGRMGNLLMANQTFETMNRNLEEKNELIEAEIKNLKQQLNDMEEELNNNKQYVRNLNEKLQNAKMSETSLKLHNDTIYKELQSLNEIKIALEKKYEQTFEELQKYRNDFSHLQSENNLLKEINATHQVKDPHEELTQEFEHISLEESKPQNTITTKAIVDKEQLKPSTEDELIDLKKQLDDLLKEKSNLEVKCEELNNQAIKVSQLEEQIKELTYSRELIMSSLTTKHQESVTYHNEIQRLNQILASESEKAYNLQLQLNNLTSIEVNNKQEVNQKIEEINRHKEEMEKLVDQNNFLREKCEVLAQNLLQEQSNVQKILSERPSASEREQVLAKKLERLQEHLVQIEETYTQELLNAEQKNNEMQAKVAEIEQREKNSSTIYTSVSIRANQQVETLHTQLQLVTNQRDELRKRISDAEDENNKQAAALTNLQFVLEQFQKDKEKDVYHETERIRKQITAEKQVQQQLKNEITSLKMQLEESKQGLQAATRLSDQLEYSKQQTTNLKQEVIKLQEKLSKTEENYNKLSSQTDSKVDKLLIKNLIIGFISSNNNLNKDQTLILKIISTVLDFNQQELNKINLNKSHENSWWGTLLSPAANNQNQEISQQSLSEAFVRFLENESKPRVIPNLLNQNTTPKTNENTGSTPRQSPSLLSEVVLPTFADFAQNRNSSSILKDVLKDNC